MCKHSILGMDLTRVPNLSLLSNGPKSENNFSCRANCSGSDRSLIEYLQREAMLGNTRFETLVSAMLIYLILGHLSVKASMCSSLTRSLAKLIAISVGVTSRHIWLIASCDRFVPHSTRSVSLMHFVLRSAIVFTQIGLYISPKAVWSIQRGGLCFENVSHDRVRD